MEMISFSFFQDTSEFTGTCQVIGTCSMFKGIDNIKAASQS